MMALQIILTVLAFYGLGRMFSGAYRVREDRKALVRTREGR